MFESLSGKFGKLDIPDGSLIKKLERIKETTEGNCEKGSLPPAVADQLKKETEEISKKIEEKVHSEQEIIKANSETIKNLDAQVSKMDMIVSSVKKTTDEFKERLDKIDETVLELVSLYEVVSSTVNPFVGDNNQNQFKEKLADIQKKVEEIGQKAPGLPTNLMQDFDNRFKALENSIEVLKKAIESNAVSEEAITEKISKLICGADMQRTAVTVQQSQASVLQQPVKAQYMIDDQDVKLSSLDNRPETSIILLSWIEFLMEKVGRNNLVDVLEYYVEIGWIGEGVSSKMMVYANGIDYYVERPTWKLLPDDHTKSLLFIEQLRGRKIDKNSLSKLERDVDKIISSDELLVL